MVIMKNIDTTETDNFEIRIPIAVDSPNTKIWFNISSYDKMLLFSEEMNKVDEEESIEYSVILNLSDFPDKHVSSLYWWNIVDDHDEELEILQPLILNR